MDIHAFVYCHPVSPPPRFSIAAWVRCGRFFFFFGCLRSDRRARESIPRLLSEWFLVAFMSDMFKHDYDDGVHSKRSRVQASQASVISTYGSDIPR